MPSTRSGKSYDPNGASVTRSGRRYGLDASVVPTSKAPAKATKVQDKPKTSNAVIERAQLEHEFTLLYPYYGLDEAILSMTASDLGCKARNKINYALGTHHFTFAFDDKDAIALGFDKLEVVFRMYHGYMGPIHSTGASSFIVHRGEESDVVVNDPETSFWRNGKEDFKFKLSEHEVASKLARHDEDVVSLFVDALVAAQSDMARFIAKVIRRKITLFKLEDKLRESLCA